MTTGTARPATRPVGLDARGARQRRGWRLLAARFALAALGLAVPLLLLELALRLAGPFLPGDYQTAAFTASSAVVGRQNQPNTAGWRRTAEFTTWVRVNSKGLRGPEIDYARSPGTYRVLVLGDSFTFALQVDEQATFVARLGERLQQDGAAVRFETINAGTDGWSTANEYAWLRMEGFHYQPDLVLVMFYVGNDPGDNADQVGSPEQVDRLRLGVERNSRLDTLRERLRSVSVAYNVFEQGVLAKLGGQPDDDEASGAKAPKDQRHLDTDRKARGWAVTEALLARMRDFCAARGARLAVVEIPLAGQVADAARSDSPLEQIGARMGVPVIDLLRPFRAQPHKLRDGLYFPMNRHWTPEGHELAAQVVADELLRQGIVPGPRS